MSVRMRRALRNLIVPAACGLLLGGITVVADAATGGPANRTVAAAGASSPGGSPLGEVDTCAPRASLVAAVTVAAANEGPYKIPIREEGAQFRREEVGASCTSSITKCTIMGNHVTKCEPIFDGRYLIVVCGSVGKNVIQVTSVDGNGTETRSLVDIECVLS